MKHLLTFLLAPGLLLAQQPNILLIMADDVDAEAFQAYASNPINTADGASIETPHIEALANQGLRFTNAFTTPICSPTRSMLLTGQYNNRNYRSFHYLDNSLTTFPKVLQANGYTTAIAGKWQLSAPDMPVTPSGVIAPSLTPSVLRDDYGFDSYLLWQLNYINSNKGSRYWQPKLETASGDGLTSVIVPTNSSDYGPDLFAEHLENFISDAAAANQPFLAYFAMALPHDPWVSTPTNPSATSGDNEIYFDENVEYIDKLVGQLVAHLEDPDGNPATNDSVRENTIIIFTSDNGTSPRITVNNSERGNVTGDKGTASYDGTHVPFIMNWSGTITSSSVESRMVDLSDVFPTLLEIAGISQPNGWILDGQPIIDSSGNVLSNKPAAYLWYDALGRSFPVAEFAQNQNYKLYADGRLFDIINDKLESTNLNDGSLTTSEQAAYDALHAVLVSHEDVNTDRSLAPRLAAIQWAVPPKAGTTQGSVTMTAGEAEDASAPIEYQFENITTGNTSAWQTSRTYESFASGTNQFRYRTRDVFENTSEWSESKEVAIIAPSLLSPDSTLLPGSLRLWLKDANANYEGGAWTDSSGHSNDLSDITGLSGYGGSFGIETLNPTSGSFSGKAVPTLRLDDNDLMGTLGINGGYGFSELTILAVYRVSTTGSGTRPVGIGSKSVEGTSQNYDRFNMATDSSIRYDDGANTGSLTHPTSLILRATRISAGNTVSDWIDSGAGLQLNINEAIIGSGSSNGTAAPNFVTKNDNFYLGEISANIGTDNPSTATYNYAQVAVYNTALSDVQIEAIADWMKIVPDGNLTQAENWRLNWFEQTANDVDAADNFDFDGDGLSNLFERAFGTDPTNNLSVYVPYNSLVDNSGNQFLALTYRRLAGGTGETGNGYTANGVTYTLEYDSDLTDPWKTGEVTVVSVNNNEDGTQTVTVRLNTPILTDGKQFIRLRVFSA